MPDNQAHGPTFVSRNGVAAVEEIIEGAVDHALVGIKHGVRQVDALDGLRLPHWHARIGAVGSDITPLISHLVCVHIQGIALGSDAVLECIFLNIVLIPEPEVQGHDMPFGGFTMEDWMSSRAC